MDNKTNYDGNENTTYEQEINNDFNGAGPEDLRLFNVTTFDFKNITGFNFNNITGFNFNNMTGFNFSDWPIPEITDNTTDQCSEMFELFINYFLPGVILFGLVGNILSCVVFLNTYLKMRSSSFYLAALSTADFGFLLSIFFVWLNNNFGIEVYNTNGWCQGLVYLSSVCSFLSVWLIVAFTVERFIAIQYPLHRPRVCTVHRAKTVISLLTGLSVVIHTYSFVAVGMKKNELGQEDCDMREGYDKLLRVINIFDSIVTLIIPLLIIVILNTLIMKSLLKSGTTVDGSSTSPEGRNDIPLRRFTRRETRDFPLTGSGNQSGETSPQGRDVNFSRFPSFTAGRYVASAKLQQNITKMLLVISTVFVLLNLPSYILRLYSLWHQKTPATLWCMQQMCMLLYYTNFSINFLLYAMYGITFRRCLRQVIQNKLRPIFHLCSPVDE